MAPTGFISVLLVLLQFCSCLGKSVIQITDNNWNMVLEGEWMLKFMAPWCPACRQFTETWSKFADWSRDLDIKVGVVDVTENPELSGRFLISALPSIYHIKDGEFRQYKSSRKEADLISLIDDKKWEEVTPVAWYLSPGSYQMGAVGFFFKLAMKMRALYTMMTDDYGIPEWGCYVIFAIVTILSGLLLGLVIVFLCDVVCPPRPSSFTIRNRGRKDDGDIIDNTEDLKKTDLKPEEDSAEEPETSNIPKQKDNSEESGKKQTRKRNVRKEN